MNTGPDSLLFGPDGHGAAAQAGGGTSPHTP
jgi:hypothetical protein